MNRYQNISKDELVERAKELDCLYLIEEALAEDSLSESLEKITSIVPKGFRNTIDCRALIELDGRVYNQMSNVNMDELISPIIVNGKERGLIKVMYPKNIFPDGDVIFLEQEARLLDTIAKRISEKIEKTETSGKADYIRQWRTILTLLQKTDHKILRYICGKMLALIAEKNPKAVQNIFNEIKWVKYDVYDEINYPLETLPEMDLIRLSEIIFNNAAKCISDAQIYDYINLWIYQGKTYDLIKIVDKKDSDANQISQALSAFMKAVKDNNMPSEATKRWLISELTSRFITDNPKVIAKIHNYVSVETFINLLDTYICSPRSVGRIGGKGSGLLLAYRIIEANKNNYPEFENIRVPKTWYISSDEFRYLLEDNGLEELNEHKYLDMFDIRISYPRIIQTLKNARMSPYILNELNNILDTCTDRPLIIRSSSLLEDQIGTAFSGKYKSLFISNKGTREERMKQLVDGILEVYASIFSPNSIQYRKERNLLDCDEQMGIIIQEVVGFRVGPYYFPIYSGVAFSNNEFCWSPRIKREDGLIRMVMGLGTRAVDRIGEDYPTLLSPGQPNLRVNYTPYELLKYSQRYIDVIDLENNQFTTIPIAGLIKEYGNQIPFINLTASVLKNDFVADINMLNTDFKNDTIIITFDRLIRQTPLVKQVKSILSLLQSELGYPVDIEFAGDGKNFYLLQCRPQSRNHDQAPVAIPMNIPAQNTIFTAHKYVSNGKVAGIKTIVYVDPYKYSRLESPSEFINVRTVISELNRLLPRRSFILMGPGRWGSRGDIKLGVPVAYADINNTAMLIEIALQQSKYEPELSFGTHFFQDLVEENIKYLPLYPEDKDVIFNQAFFRSSRNALADMVPAYAYLNDVVKVIKIEEAFPGKELTVLMNGDIQKAVAYLDNPAEIKPAPYYDDSAVPESIPDDDDGWKWRHYMAEQIAAMLDMEAYSVKGIYLFGSTNNGTAKLNSDIDLIIHFDGTEQQKERLNLWLLGWSQALSEMNYLKTGYKTGGLLDVHYITDEDIKNKTSFAIKINSVFDPATPLRIRQQP